VSMSGVLLLYFISKACCDNFYAMGTSKCL
jgi:hypothetical protein